MHPNEGEGSDQNVPGVCLWLEPPEGSDRGVLTVWIESVPQESGLVCGYRFLVVKCTLWEIRSRDIFRRRFPPTKGNQIQGILRRNCDYILFKDKVRENEVALDFPISLSRAFRDPVVCLRGTLDETECTIYSTVYDLVACCLHSQCLGQRHMGRRGLCWDITGVTFTYTCTPGTALVSSVRTTHPYLQGLLCSHLQILRLCVL